ncbi:MAG: sigma-54-dependent Fis family transcriptional regulator [bacterium]
MTASEAGYQQQIASLQERLQLQELISDISAILVNLPASEVDGQIERGLQRIVECLGVDRSGFADFSEDRKELRQTHSYAVPGIERSPVIVLSDTLPWYARQLQRGDIVAFERPDELPEEASAEKAYCQQSGLKSHLCVPVAIGGSMICAIGFASFRSYRSWPEAFIEQFKRVVEIFAHALYRKHAEEELLGQYAKLESQFQFEKIISALSARFVKLHAEQVDREIEAALRQILEFFQIDRCGLLHVSPDKKEVKLTHACHAEGLPEMAEGINYHEHYPWSTGKVLSGETLSFHVKDLPPEAAIDRQHAEKIGTRSRLLIPLVANGSVDYLMSINSVRSERVWPQELTSRFRLIGEFFVNALVRQRAEADLQKSYNEIKRLKDRVQLEAEYLHAEIKGTQRYGDIVGESPAMRHVLNQLEQVAPTQSSVLICGETGAGKELIALAIHDLSPRKARVMVKVNCATLPSTLIESELFGREKGAYTGALTRQTGRFEVADGSTIFLDEIGELSHELQKKLLRVLQEGEFERLGSPKTIQVDVRVIAATNRDLVKAIRQGIFREDLYYRLNVFPISVPPLRERPEDIPVLVWAFLKEFGERMGKKTPTVPKNTMAALQQYRWPGNIRELRNIIEHAVIISSGDVLQVQFPQEILSSPDKLLALADIERQHIIKILEMTKWRIKGPHGAAKLLGLEPSTLYGKMSKLGIPYRRKKDHIPT